MYEQPGRDAGYKKIEKKIEQDDWSMEDGFCDENGTSF